MSRATSNQITTTITMNDELMHLVLTPSPAIEQTYASSLVDGSNIPITATAYVGYVASDPTGWLRLVIDKDWIDGIIHYNGQYWKIYTDRLNDVYYELWHPHSHRDVIPVPDTADQTLPITLLIDKAYNADGRGLARALSVINVVDGIYREQFNVGLQVVHVVQSTQKDDPLYLPNSTMAEVLHHILDHRNATPFISKETHLVHAFIGYETTDPPVGLSWLKPECGIQGFDLSISGPYTYPYMLTSHEIAHTLGMAHDTKSLTCKADVESAMWPFIDINSSHHFSSCAKSVVKSRVANGCYATMSTQSELNFNNTN